MQKEFEAWYIETYYAGDQDCGMEWLSTDVCGGYIYHHPSEQWKTWKASREALVVELPGMIGMNQSFTGTPISEIRAHNHFNDAIGKCRKAIHAAGVRTK